MEGQDKTAKLEERISSLEKIFKTLMILVFVTLTCSLAALAITFVVLFTGS